MYRRVIRLSAIILSVIDSCNILLSVIVFVQNVAVCHSIEIYSTECHSSKCHFAENHSVHCNLHIGVLRSVILPNVILLVLFWWVLVISVMFGAMPFIKASKCWVSFIQFDFAQCHLILKYSKISLSVIFLCIIVMNAMALNNTEKISVVCHSSVCHWFNCHHA